MSQFSQNWKKKWFITNMYWTFKIHTSELNWITLIFAENNIPWLILNVPFRSPGFQRILNWNNFVWIWSSCSNNKLLHYFRVYVVYVQHVFFRQRKSNNHISYFVYAQLRLSLILRFFLNFDGLSAYRRLRS